MEWDIPLDIPANVFEYGNNGSATLHVPAGTKALYEAAEVWKTFGTIVEPASTGTVFADNSLQYVILSIEDKTVAVTYKNEWGGSYSGNIVIPSTVEYEGVEYSVIAIGDRAFSSCWDMMSITIPNSVTSIGDGAFYFCNMMSITIPNSVTSIGNGVFGGCSLLTNIVVDSANPTYDSRENCNAIIETASNTLVAGCKTTIIPNSVTSIGEQAFPNCWGLASITIPNSVTSIGSEAFSGCSYLMNITIPNSVTSIGSGAFVGCSYLMNITIPNSVTSIGSGAFGGCGGLTNIVVDSANPTYDSRENCNAIIETASNTLVAGCKTTIIPNSVTSIGDQAFYGCSGLTSITIPNSVTSIGEQAFGYCSGLLDCYVEWDIPLDIPANVFEYSNNGSATLHVPTGTKARYEAAEVWKNFGTIVEYTVSGLDAVIANKQPGRLYRLDGTSVPSGQKMKGAMIIDGRAVIIR